MLRIHGLLMAALAVAAGGSAGCFGALQTVGIVGPMGHHRGGEPGEPLEVRLPDGVRLHGFLVRAPSPSRGTVVLLHGLGDQAAVWSEEARRLARAGYDALAWDARGHGGSDGLCSYGARERDDLGPMLDAAGARGANVSRVLLFGFSLGAVVALQAAVRDSRVRAVVAVAPWVSVERVVHRVAAGMPGFAIDRALAAAQRLARFDAAAIRPLDDAGALRVPLLVVSGTGDRLAPPADGAAIARAAGERGRLLLVHGASHDEVLRRCGECAEALREVLAEAGMGPRAAAGSALPQGPRCSERALPDDVPPARRPTRAAPPPSVPAPPEAPPGPARAAARR